MLVRSATIADVETLTEFRVALHREVDDSHHPPAPAAGLRERCMRFFSETIPSGEFAAWIAYEGDRAAGTGGVLFRRALPSIRYIGTEEVKIQNMYVIPEMRNLGIGRMIAQTILEFLHARGTERITLSPAERARAFYERLGFHDSPFMRL